MPAGSILKDLGDYNRKWRTLYAAELYVETLVASNVMATIGGRVMVAPTVKLIADITTSQTTIDVDYASLLVNDFVYMSASPNGIPQIEAMKVTAYNGAITGGHRYTVTRNLDGGSATAWVAGDAIVSLGNAAGKGYIDLSAVSTIRNHFGPTMAVYVRTGTSLWTDVAPVVASGNLRSFVDYSADEFGFGTANNLTLTPTTGLKGVTVDRTNGVRLFNVDISLYNSGTLKTKIQNTGEVFFGSVSGARLEWNGTKLRGVNGSAVEQWYADSTDGKIYAGAGNTFLDASGVGINAEFWSVSYPSAPANTKSVRWVSDVGLAGLISGDYAGSGGGSNRIGSLHFHAYSYSSAGSKLATTAMRLDGINGRLYLDADLYMTGAITSPISISTGASLPLELITSTSGPYSLALTRSDIPFTSRLFNDGTGFYFEHRPSIPDTLRIRATRTPASASAAGTAGDFCYDGNYLYMCVATNTWKRAALATW